MAQASANSKTVRTKHQQVVLGSCETQREKLIATIHLQLRMSPMNTVKPRMLFAMAAGVCTAESRAQWDSHTKSN